MLLQLHEPGQTPLPHQEERVIVGIDLGTTHSLVALYKDTQAYVVVDKTPSVVAYDNHQFVVGEKALNLEGAVQSVKRYMTDPGAKNFSFPGLNKPLTAIDVSAEILKYLKSQAEEILKRPIKEIVLTVPAYFDDAARTATRDAARLAGLEVVRMINEPTAAALAYGLESGAEGVYGIYDLGGGTFDFSVLRLEKGVFQVLATGGDTHLGGDDFDICLKSLGPEGLSLREARSLKERLSQESCITYQGYTFLRSEYESLIRPFIDKTLQICHQVLQDASLQPMDLKGLVLVGGATRTPYVQFKLAEFIGRAPLTNIHPDEAIALGAAHQANCLKTGQGVLLLDVAPLSLGLEMMGGTVEKIIPRHSPLPISVTQEFTTSQDGQGALLIHVLQGEREKVENCRSLARFELRGIPSMAAGIPRIEITFTLDADGLLSVCAREKHTGIMQSIEVHPTYGLPPQQIEAMIEAAYLHAKEDWKEKNLQEAVIEAQRLMQATEKAIKEDGDLLAKEHIESIQKQLKALEQTLELSQEDKIIKETNLLKTLTHSFAEARLNRALEKAFQGQAVADAL